MKIIIDEAHKEKITAALDEVQKRCTARTVTADKIIKAVDYLRSIYGITKKALDGTTASIDLNAQEFPGAYRYMPESTCIEVSFANNKAYLTWVCRDRCTNTRYSVKLSDTAKEAILKKAARPQ